jgi:hypothetical protein
MLSTSSKSELFRWDRITVLKNFDEAGLIMFHTHSPSPCQCPTANGELLEGVPVRGVQQHRFLRQNLPPSSTLGAVEQILHSIY